MGENGQRRPGKSSSAQVRRVRGTNSWRFDYAGPNFDDFALSRREDQLRWLDERVLGLPRRCETARSVYCRVTRGERRKINLGGILKLRSRGNSFEKVVAGNDLSRSAERIYYFFAKLLSGLAASILEFRADWG